MVQSIRFQPLAVLLSILPQAHFAIAQEEDPLPRYTSVIPQILYRSGSPNDEGLDWLCRSGFRGVYSIYGSRTTQFGPRNEPMTEQGYDERTCLGPDGGTRSLEWKSAAVRGRIPMILDAVRQAIQSPEDGPILVHCWGGRHYSVLISTLALQQFCGYSTEKAVAYLHDQSDNAQLFPQLRERIESFKRIARLTITPQQQARFCGSTAPDRWARAMEYRPPAKRSTCTWFAGGLAWRRFTSR